MFTISIKAATYAALIFSILFARCDASKRLHSSYGMNLIVSYPYVNAADGKLTNFRDTIGIYYFDNYILYSLTATRRLETDDNIDGSRQFFLYKKESNFGVLFDSLNLKETYSRVPADSVLSQRAFKGTRFNEPDDSIWRRKIVRQNENSFYEEFSPIKELSANSVDTIYYYYNSLLKDIDFTLSSQLDKSSGSKLYMVRLIFNEEYFTESKIQIPKREFLFLIKKVETHFDKKMLKIIEKVKNKLKY